MGPPRMTEKLEVNLLTDDRDEAGRPEKRFFRSRVIHAVRGSFAFNGRFLPHTR